MSINLGVRYLISPEAVAIRARYARIDNVVTPSFVTVTPNITSSPAIIAQNVDNGQYAIELTPITADGRINTPRLYYTPACPGLYSISAYIQSGNLIVQYTAPSDVPKVLIRVDYPNGGQNIASYVNNGNNIVIALPDNVNGDFFVYGQSACDESTGFYSPLSNAVTVTKNSNPSITQTSQSDTGTGGTRTQIFTVNPPVSVNNRYVLTVYSHNVSVVANSGDTPSSIATKIAAAINATTEGQWNDQLGAPVTGTPGFKPTAAASGAQVTIVLNYQNQFSANAYNT